MKRGGKKMMRTVLLLTAALLLIAGPAFADERGKAAAAAPSEMAGLLKELGERASDFKTLKTEFVQEKKMAMFEGKLVLKGRIYLQKPNRLAWHVDSPLRYSVLITDKLVRQWDEETDQVQEFALAKNPVFQNVLNQLTVWFSGEYGSLLETNEVRLVKENPVVLEFTPKAGNMAEKVISSITVVFREDQRYLQSISIKEVSGDVTVLRFLNTLLNAPLKESNFEVKGRV